MAKIEDKKTTKAYEQYGIADVGICGICNEPVLDIDNYITSNNGNVYHIECIIKHIEYK